MPGKSAGHGVERVPREPVGPAGGSPAAAVGPEVTGSGGAPDQHDLRLMALLAELVRERGRAGAAEALDLDPRTVVAALKRGALSRRVRSALERVGTAEGPDEEVVVAKAEPATAGSAIEERVAAVEQQVEEVRELVQADGRALQEEHTRDLRQVELRLGRLESLLGAAAKAPGAIPGGEPMVGGPGPASRESPVGSREVAAPEPTAAAMPAARRQHPSLVTREPAPDDAQVYGEAWALVDEWRRRWQVHERPGKGLAWLKQEVRILELEVAMLQEHELTLPPATYAQRGIELHTHLGWRLQALANRRRAPAWAQLGRWVRCGLVFALLAGVTTFMLLASASS